MSRLTVARVKQLSEPGLHADGSTLYLRVAPSGGARSWIQRLTINGKRHDLGLGAWPLTSLREARDKAFANRKLARDGGDPLVAKRRATGLTFRQASERALEANRAKWRNPKTADGWIATMEAYAYPVFGDHPVNEVGRENVLLVLTPIWSTKPELARKIRTRLRAVFAWAQAHNLITENPAAEGVSGALPSTRAQKRHFRALAYADVAAALDTIEAAPSALAVKAALRFTILTACRSGEVRGATWAEVEVGDRVWTVPAERTKTAKPHRVPLSDAAIDVLESVRALRDDSDLLFPSPVRAGRPLSDMSLLKCLRDTGLADRTVVHGFRSSFRTWAAERTRASFAVAEACLAHEVGGAVSLSYKRSDLFERRRQLMAAWAAYLTGSANKVVRLHG